MIVFDLDGCLADCEHRRHFVDVSKAVEKGIAYEDTYCNIGGIQSNGYFLTVDPVRRWQPDYRAFYEACDKDLPIAAAVKIANSFFMNNILYQIWTARCESVRQQTENWLDAHDIQYTELKMRPIGDSTPDDVLKEKWLDEFIENAHVKAATNAITGSGIAYVDKIDFVFDDRPKVIRMWRRRGIFVFNCCQHDDEF